MLGRLKAREVETRVMVADFEVDPGFTFQPGEYIQIILGSGQKRYFSVVNSPNEKGIVRIATRPSRSEFKKMLAEMPLGTKVEIQGPWGDLLLPRDNSRPLIFIAGGIGITPFLSMLGYMVQQKLPNDATLLYFTGDRLFEEQLLRVMGEIGKGKLIIIQEHINPTIIKKHIEDTTNNVFYIAGPPGFVNSAVAGLRSLGILGKNIIFESYTGY